MSVRAYWDEIRQRLVLPWREPIARSTIAEDFSDTDEREDRSYWKPTPGQSVVVVALCGTAAHHRGLTDEIIGCRGRVSGVQGDDDHPFEVTISRSANVDFYDRFAAWELAPLSRAIAKSRQCQSRDRSAPPGCRPQVALGLDDGRVGAVA